MQTFHFNKKRVRVLSKSQDVPQNAKAILYWMSRDQRVQGTYAFTQMIFIYNEMKGICIFLYQIVLQITGLFYMHKDWLLNLNYHFISAFVLGSIYLNVLCVISILCYQVCFCLFNYLCFLAETCLVGLE